MRTTLLLDNGTQVSFRSIQPTDEPNMRDLLYDLSQETVYYRFMSRQKRFTHRQIQDFVYVDHRKDVAIVGTVPEAAGEEIVAVGRYFLNERSNKAEVAFVIRDDWQNQGIGKFLFKHLIDHGPAQRHRRLYRRGAARQPADADHLQPLGPQGAEPHRGGRLQLRHRFLRNIRISCACTSFVVITDFPRSWSGCLRGNQR